MSIARIAACLVASAALLAACSKPGPTASPGASSAAASASGPATTAPVSVPASEMPSMKVGLWEIHMLHAKSGAAGTPAVVRQCLTDADMASAKTTAATYAKAHCSKNAITRLGDTWTDDTICKMGASTMTGHTVTTLNGDGAYHTELTTHYDPPIGSLSDGVTTIDGKWVGPCTG